MSSSPDRREPHRRPCTWTGASAALHISDIPWAGPLVGVRVSRVDGELISFPTFEQQAKSDIDLVVACSKDAITMVEGGAAEATEADIIDALMFAHRSAQPILELIEKMRAAVGRTKRVFTPEKLDESIAHRVATLCDKGILESSLIKDKAQRYGGYKTLRDSMLATLKTEIGDEKYAKSEKLLKAEFEERKYNVVREYVMSEKRRIDGRDSKTIRPIMTEVALLPRVHGSALFQRAARRRRSSRPRSARRADEQKIDGSPRAVEALHAPLQLPAVLDRVTKPPAGPGRREIGHGALAERALARMMPDQDKFPYTIRVVSETLESNGSSSMAAVWRDPLLMDAGVPIKAGLSRASRWGSSRTGRARASRS